MSRTSILREQQASEARVVNEADRARRAAIALEKQEIAVAFDSARRALATPQALADRNGVAFAVGDEVRSLSDLWCSNPNRPTLGPKRMIAGARGVIASIGRHNASVMFEGRVDPYFFRLDRMTVELEVVK